MWIIHVGDYLWQIFDSSLPLLFAASSCSFSSFSRTHFSFSSPIFSLSLIPLKADISTLFYFNTEKIFIIYLKAICLDLGYLYQVSSPLLLATADFEWLHDIESVLDYLHLVGEDVFLTVDFRCLLFDFKKIL